MARRRRTMRLVFGLAMIVGMLSLSIPAFATTTSLPQSDGCNGTGSSFQNGSYLSSKTTTPGCTWKYLDCYFTVYGLPVHTCPGWTTSNVQYDEYQASSVTSYHSLCQAGGPCASATYYQTTGP